LPGSPPFSIDAQGASLDKRRILADDHQHSVAKEKRHYCFGSHGGGIMTVRFTYRDGVIRILGQATGPRVSKKLVVKEEVEKVTISLSKRSVEFFKFEER